MRTTKSMLFNDKTLKILLALNNANLKKKTSTHLAKETGAVYCHVTNVIKVLEDDNIIEKSKDGRNSFLELTEKGKQISIELSKIMKLF